MDKRGIDITCESCSTLFGRANIPGVLDIKMRDITRRVTGGTVEGPCRRCGNVVVWRADPQPYLIQKGALSDSP